MLWTIYCHVLFQFIYNMYVTKLLKKVSSLSSFVSYLVLLHIPSEVFVIIAMAFVNVLQYLYLIQSSMFRQNIGARPSPFIGSTSHEMYAWTLFPLFVFPTPSLPREYLTVGRFETQITMRGSSGPSMMFIFYFCSWIWSIILIASSFISSIRF